MTCYEILGIPREATDDEIKTAYKRMAKKYHPDVFEGCADFAHEKMQRINEAYDVLCDDARREEYDYALWREERDGKLADYANEYENYMPRHSRADSRFSRNEQNQSEQNRYEQNRYERYEQYERRKRAAPNPRKAARSRKITAVYYSLRIIIPAAVVFMVLGIILRVPLMMNFLDWAYGRGTPAEVAGIYFDSIKEQDFDRTYQITGGLASVRGTSMSTLTNIIRQTYGFNKNGVPYGQLWLGGNEKTLRHKILKTERDGFNFASVTVEVTNFNSEKNFVLSQLKIEEAIRKGTGKMTLLNAIRYKDYSLVEDVYREYLSEAAAASDDYISATVTLHFFRPAARWIINSADDYDALKNVILGGFGEGAPGRYDEYINIDWHKALRIEQ